MSHNMMHGANFEIAVDNARLGVRVNAVAPAWVEGPMVAHERSVNPNLDAMIKVAVPLGGRAAQPDEVSDTIVFLCSPSASFISGHTVIVDGGATLTLRPN